MTKVCTYIVFLLKIWPYRYQTLHVLGNYGPWSEWSDCSRTRFRTCRSPQDCKESDLSEVAPCSKKPEDNGK